MPHKNDTMAWVETELNTSLVLYLVLRQISQRVVTCFYSSVCHEGQHVSVALVTTSLSDWICSKFYTALRGPSLLGCMHRDDDDAD